MSVGRALAGDLWPEGGQLKTRIHQTLFILLEGIRWQQKVSPHKQLSVFLAFGLNPNVVVLFRKMVVDSAISTKQHMYVTLFDRNQTKNVHFLQ